MMREGEYQPIRVFPIGPESTWKVWQRWRQPHAEERRAFPTIHVLLFVVTVLTTMAAGAIQSGINPLENPGGIVWGIPFSFTLLFILLTHELGHYMAARHYQMEVSLPYLIPAPSFIGTFGAFIKMRSPVRDKRSLMDIGAAGPLAGLLAAIPVLLVGLKLSEVRAVASGPLEEGGVQLGTSLLFEILTRLTVGSLPEHRDLVLHPVAFAGWIGLLVTALNLLPVGQLDGGHILYAIVGPRSVIISRIVVGILVVLGVASWTGWLFWALILTILGSRHPFPLDFWTPLNWQRKILGFIMLAVFILTFTPVPFSGF